MQPLVSKARAWLCKAKRALRDEIVGDDPIRTRMARRRGGGDDDSDSTVESEERGGFMFVTSLVSFP